MNLRQLLKPTLLAIAICTLVGCNKNEPDSGIKGKQAWGATHGGEDTKLKAFPDLHAYYWEYTFDAEAYPNIGLRIEGTFPNARFFNFNVYDDVTQKNDLEQFSREDYQIVPNDGKENPYVATSTTDKNPSYTLYILPEHTPASFSNDKKNICWFQKDLKRVVTFLRYYIPEGGAFGGVEMPYISAFDINTGKDVELPKRGDCTLVVDGVDLPASTWKSQPIMAFFRAPFSMMYPNGPAEYTYTTNLLNADEVMMFNFKAPSFPKSKGEYADADMRYWSLCLGGENTMSYLSVYDKNTLIGKDGFATYVIADKNSAKFADIDAACKERGYNLMAWDVAKNKSGIMVLYRHLLYNKDYEWSLRKKMETYPQYDKNGAIIPAYPNPKTQIAHNALGEYGAFGKKLSEADFINKVNATIVRP